MVGQGRSGRCGVEFNSEAYVNHQTHTDNLEAEESTTNTPMISPSISPKHYLCNIVVGPRTSAKKVKENTCKYMVLRTEFGGSKSASVAIRNCVPNDRFT
jgi:hypothetical protein